MAYRTLTRQSLHYFSRPHEGVSRAPLQVPAAWASSELSDDWRYDLSPREIGELHDAMAMAQRAGRPLAQMKQDDFPLRGLAQRIRQWRDTLMSGRGFQVVSGVPVADWSEQQRELFFWCFGQHLGLPGAQNPRGDLLGHVYDETAEGDRGAMPVDPRYYRTRSNIAFHCDAADVVGLLCVRKARSGGVSRIVSSVRVYNELLREHPEMVERLYQPFYMDTHGEGGICAMPVVPCRYFAGELRTTYHSDYFRSAGGLPGVPPLSDDERRLLDTYERIAMRPALYLDMDLQPGDIQLLSNHTQLHARTAYVDHKVPGRGRHLLRLWLSLPQRRTPRAILSTLRSRLGLILTLIRQRRLMPSRG